MTTIALPTAGGRLERFEVANPPTWHQPQSPIRSRVAYAAAHVVADPLGENVPGGPPTLDWDATLAVRRGLWSWGLGVAEAMDTAQRGMGLDWPTVQELIRRSAAEAQAVGGRLAAGASTDHLHDDESSLADIVAAYEEQVAFVEKSGATAVVMASRALAQVARHSDDYETVYSRVLSKASKPVIVHWLGAMFDPALTGYWGSSDLDLAAETVRRIVCENAQKIDGVKVSLLDVRRETDLRRKLPAGVRLYTGDDFNYPALIRGDDAGASDALLGVFAAIAPAASAALQALDRGDLPAYDAALEPTVPLAHHIFGAPTAHYKTGIAFTSWLTGNQPGFTMIGGLQSFRSLPHLAKIFRLASGAGLLPDPELAAHRMRTFLALHGVSA